MHRDSGRRRTAWAATLSVALVTGAATLTATAPSGAASTVLPRTTLTAVARDLGTLGGRSSEAVDLDGTVVVGTADTATGARHAFAYDLTTATMQDLGTLGGGTSEAVAVDGTVVVGNSLTAAGEQHAFAYDLSHPSSGMRDLGQPGAPSYAADVDAGVVVGSTGTQRRGASGHAFAYDLNATSPTMRDLGTGGWNFSNATAVSQKVVVGVAGLDVDETQHPFVYDLGAATPTMRDLGTLGFDLAEAVDVDNGLVVGNSLTSQFEFDLNGRHPFAYDLRADSPRMRDLGDLGYDRSFATAVGQGLVVGKSQTSRYSIERAFVRDLRATSSRLQDLGSLGGNQIHPEDVSDGVVVGRGSRAADGVERAFAYDLRAARPEITDLGTLGGRRAAAYTVRGRTVVGASDNAAGVARATVWSLRATATPALRFSGYRYSAKEAPGHVRVTVERAGSTAAAVSVRYAARSARAVAGKDFRSTSGTLRFAAGETRKTFQVSILGDSSTEPPEPIALTLAPHGTGSILGTPRTAGLVIAASDQRADALISTQDLEAFVGNDVINRTGARQTRTSTARRTAIRSFRIHVQNDGNAVNTYTYRGTGVGPGAAVRYFLGSTDVTRKMRSAAGLRHVMEPGSLADLTARVTILRGAAVGSRHVAAMSATWRGDVTRTDVVRGVVRVVR